MLTSHNQRLFRRALNIGEAAPIPARVEALATAVEEIKSRIGGAPGLTNVDIILIALAANGLLAPPVDVEKAAPRPAPSKK